jgi:hypothetical protein
MRVKTDSEIEQWVLRELSSSDRLCSREVCVFSYDGVVRLRGTAQNYRDKLAIALAARRAPGVVGVVNEMRVRPCTALIEKRFAIVSLTDFMPEMLGNRIGIQPPAAKAARA